jgi:hypothetical protein
MALDYQNTDPVILGSGELYLGKVDNPESASEATIEAALKNVGAIDSGAEVSYSPEFEEIRSANRGLITRLMTSEEVTFSCGVMTWVMENLAEIAPSTLTTDATTGEKRLQIGGQKELPINYLRFIHKKKDGGELIVNILKAQVTNGFNFAFDGDAASVFEYEFSALYKWH